MISFISISINWNFPSPYLPLSHITRLCGTINYNLRNYHQQYYHHYLHNCEINISKTNIKYSIKSRPSVRYIYITLDYTFVSIILMKHKQWISIYGRTCYIYIYNTFLLPPFQMKISSKNQMKLDIIWSFRIVFIHLFPSLPSSIQRANKHQIQIDIYSIFIIFRIFVKFWKVPFTFIINSQNTNSKSTRKKMSINHIFRTLYSHLVYTLY